MRVKVGIFLDWISVCVCVLGHDKQKKGRNLLWARDLCKTHMAK